MLKINSNKIFDVINYALLILITLILLYPIYFVLIASFSDVTAVAGGEVVLWPIGFTLDSYKEVFRYDQIWLGYRNTIIYTVFGTILNLFLTIPPAYALTKKNMMFRGVISGYFIFTMYFGGNMISSYILLRTMGLINKVYTLVILSGISISNVVVTRTFFTTTIPDSLYEAAEMDGCSEFKKFVKIALPLSKPILAVMTLYYAVGRWNSYMGALIYINDTDYYPLQLVLRNVLIMGQSVMQQVESEVTTAEELEALLKLKDLAEAMKYSMIFIGALPMLIAYPFVQKHFVKGVMIGSLKG